MFDIVSIEPDDNTVKIAINAILNGQGVIPNPNGNYRVFLRNASLSQGDGGTGSHIVVVVGHGNANRLSGCKSWKEYKQDVNDEVEWQNATTVYLVACSTADEGTAFRTGNIAREVKEDFPQATVWASSSKVEAWTQNGDWQKL